MFRNGFYLKEVIRINLSGREVWMSFFPNFLAVVAGIVLTFGTERIVEGVRHRDDVQDVVQTMKDDAGEALEFYRNASADCKQACILADSIIAAGGHYDSLPARTLQHFLYTLLAKDIYTSNSPAEDILRQSGVLQYMEPEILGLIDDLRTTQAGLSQAMTAYLEDLDRVRDGLYMDSRRFPEAMRDSTKLVATVQFVMAYPPCYNYMSKCPLAYLARLIDRECAQLEKSLAELEAAGY